MALKTAERRRRLTIQAGRVETAISQLENSISLTGDKHAKLYELHCQAARLCVQAAALHDDQEHMFGEIFNAAYHRREALRVRDKVEVRR